MKLFQQEALGTLLHIHLEEKDAHQSDVDECFLSIKNFEAKYSRFIHGNTLDTLNSSGGGNISSEFHYLIETALQLHKNTNGYFDITLLPLLENNGYGISNHPIHVSTGMQHIELTKKNIKLLHGVKLDLGGLGKGYMLDTIAKMLGEKYKNFTLNFGGDIYVSQSKKIYLEDPLNPEKHIGEFHLSKGSLCSSSGIKRKIETGHHIINPLSQISPNDKISLYTYHSHGIYADAYATALYAAPLEICLEILEKTDDLEGMIIAQDGKIHASKGFIQHLTLY